VREVGTREVVMREAEMRQRYLPREVGMGIEKQERLRDKVEVSWSSEIEIDYLTGQDWKTAEGLYFILIGNDASGNGRHAKSRLFRWSIRSRWFASPYHRYPQDRVIGTWST